MSQCDKGALIIFEFKLYVFGCANEYKISNNPIFLYIDSGMYIEKICVVLRNIYFRL